GEISMIVRQAPSATVVADTPVRVLALGMTHLRSHLTRDLEFAANFYHGLTVLLASRLRRTTRLLGYGGGAIEDVEPAEEIDIDAVDGLRLAHQRFDRLVSRFTAREFA